MTDIAERCRIILKKKAYRIASGIVFILLIAWMAFCRVDRGMDITDSTYSLTNFLFADKMDGMWYYSTFYANLLGSLLVKLPFGNTLLGMNVYTGLIRFLIGVLSYFFFVKEVGMARELSFLGSFIAVAFCWCPTTILYNYLTYLFFFLGAAFLYRGLTKEKKTSLVLAGFFLGTNFFVRLPNVAEAALIVALFLYSVLKREKFTKCLVKTVCCILGYAIAFIPGMVLIMITRGFDEYVKGIQELFSMTEESTGYSPVAMVLNSARAYLRGWKWDEITIFMLLLCSLAFLVFPAKIKWARYVSSTAVTGAFVVLLYKKNLFDVNIYYHAAIYRSGALLLTICLVWLLGTFVHRASSDEEKLLAIIALGVIVITPLGSNNELYSNINNLFFVLPAFLFLLFRFSTGNEYFRGVRYSLFLLTGVIGIYAMIVSYSASFRDGLDGRMNVEVKNNPVVKGMKTTEYNAKCLEELFDLWDDKSLEGSKVLLYGNVSGLGFYLGSAPAISTAWPSLSSFSTSKFEADMKDLRGMILYKGEPAPVVIIGKEEQEGIFSEASAGKQEILKEFLVDNDYNVAYDNHKFLVYLAR